MASAGNERTAVETTSATRWRKVKTILAAALEVEDARTRTSFIEKACAGDTALMAEIELLLAQDTAELEQCADHAVTVCTRDDESQIGRRLGAYEVVREISRGGMGIVYLAQRVDGEFEKQVAIKLLKRGTDTDEILRRFRAERRILARLDHPNIARLLDAGTTNDGLPYFVMEYVDGEAITEYARQKQLSIPRRLELFLKVCSAAEWAHQNHVVHRDLKPSNVLVRPDGEPKLLDFGIAKLLDPGAEAHLMTLTQQRRFTPACASPEQALGKEVTGASDVYALGALLYELLSDQVPHRFSSAHLSNEEVARIICQQEALPPSNVARDETKRALRGDLDKIVLRALRKEPENRYASAGALADDIRRHLEGRPVQARRHTAGYVGRRFLRRHTVAISVITSFAALSLGGGAIWFRQARAADVHSALLKSEALSLLSDFHTDWRIGRPSAALTEGERAAAILHELCLNHPRDASLQENEAYALQCAAIAQRALGNLPGAANDYRRAEKIYASLAQSNPENQHDAALLHVMQRELTAVSATNDSQQSNSAAPSAQPNEK